MSLPDFALPFVKQLPPEAAHTATIKGLKIGIGLPNIPPSTWKTPIKLPRSGLQLSNPVGLAAGFDKNAEVHVSMARFGFGFLECGTVTPRPQEGNPKPRLFRLTEDKAVINRMGFNNKGIDYLVKKVKNSSYKGVLGINIGKNKVTPNSQALSDYVHCFEKSHMLCDYITVNISSPNTPDLRELQNDEQLTQLLTGMKQAQIKAQKEFDKYTPILVKISPDQSKDQLKFMTRQIIDSGMDGIICTNTTISRDNLESDKKLTDQIGGLSGAPLTEKANETLRLVRQFSGSTFPIIAVGGIISDKDAVEKIKLGANLVQIYTGFVYKGNGLIRDINNALK